MPKPTAVFDSPSHAPTVDQHIQDELLALFPRVFLRWSHDKNRWELWSELTNVTHPDARHTRAKGDRYVSEFGCWVRFLQVYKNEDESFAPADERLLVGLAMADTWANRRFYEERIVEPHKYAEMRKKAEMQDLASSAARYYHKIQNPIVGRHSRKADWRHGTW
jgi:hypothetical protein